MNSMGRPTPPILWMVVVLGLILPGPALGEPDTTRELVEVLESEAPLEEKAIACRRLGEIGTGEAVPALARLLDQEVLGAYARSSLERIPDPTAAAALRAALRTTEGSLLVGVITSVGTLRDEQAVPDLADLVGHDDRGVGRAALIALGRVASPVAIPVVKAALDSRREGAASACLLAAEREGARGRPAGALTLYDAVRTADVPEAARLAALRGAIVTRRSVPFLMEQLDSADPSTRQVALLAIREMPSAALAEALHSRLNSAPPELRASLVLALADCHDGYSFAVVRSQLDSEAEAVRLAALRVVSAVGSGPELAEALLAVLRDRRSVVERQTAIELLTRMEDGHGVEDVMRRHLRHTPAVDVRIDVMRILGDRQARGAVGDLLEQTRDPEPRVRTAAFRSLRRLAGPAEVAPLVALIEVESDASARAAATLTLVGACGEDPDSGDLILSELKEASGPSERDVWIRVLTAVGHQESLPIILQGLESEDEDVVAATVAHLGRWPDPTPVDALLPLLDAGDGSPVRNRAVTAVIQLAANAAHRRQRPDDVLTRWLGRAEAAVRTVGEKRLLLSALGRVHTLGSLRLLRPYMRDPEVQTEALYALLSVGSPLVKEGQTRAVREALPDDWEIEEDDLRWRMSQLREQAEAAETAP
jgi:HEAT repeat protein